jgi:tetratricopeptide (TPR) repeat protein
MAVRTWFGAWFGGGSGLASWLATALWLAPLPAQADEWPLALKDAQRQLQKGALTAAAGKFQEILDAAEEKDGPSQDQLLAARAGLLELQLRHGAYEDVVTAVEGMPEAAANRGLQLLAARALQALSRYDAAIAVLQPLVERDKKDIEARYRLGDVLAEQGKADAAKAAWTAALSLQPKEALQLAYLGRCHWRLGGRDHLEAGSQALVAALDVDPAQPEARTTYGILKFEAYREAAGFPSGEKELQKVLEQCGDVEEALLAMYRIRSGNHALDPRKTEQFLDRVIGLNPRSVPALVERGRQVLDDRRYKDGRAMLDLALHIAPDNRLALAHRAAAAYLLHDQQDYLARRQKALAGDPKWPEVDRILGDHLVALYRFADALPFYETARQLDDAYVPTLHGMAKALIYIGEGEKAKELLMAAKDREPGLVDTWRNNALNVQQKLDDDYTVAQNEQFSLQLHKDDADVLREYMMPLHLKALDELGKKYECKPDRRVKVEVFHTWDDFSERTIGYRGFTALGACFGTFITLVSPVDANVRKQDFMWEATVWHEYTHVLTLSLSRHRVPRWLTEGFSVYEEKQRNAAWERGMDRELFDAVSNKDIAPVALLNRLFRGPRILFGYYQGGLIVELLARDFGFKKAIALLAAFGDDLDTEDAFQRALGITSQAFDQRFLAWVQQDKLRSMRLVPRSDDAAMAELRRRAAADQHDIAARLQLAWGCTQRRNPVDAGRYLAEVLRAEPKNGSALLCRAALCAARGDFAEAVPLWQQGFAAGGDDFDSRIACGRALLKQGDADGAVQQFQRAKACWPACTEPDDAPELLLARLYRDQGQTDQALMEMKAYCQRSGRAYAPRIELADHEHEAGTPAAEARYLEECRSIDPFSRDLHSQLGAAYEALARKAEAALEYEVGAAVPTELDRKWLAHPRDRPADNDRGEAAARAALRLQAAKLRKALGDLPRAEALLERVIRDGGDSEAATAARTLREEWRGK